MIGYQYLSAACSMLTPRIGFFLRTCTEDDV
jgi:hypothetical protein